MQKKPRFHCKSEAQKRAIRRSYAQKKEIEKNSSFPEEFPFWARLKISKNRTTLVIDEELAYNKQKKRMEEGYVHREAIHPNADRSNVKGFEEIKPNPDKSDKDPMYLKGPSKLPKRLFRPHNKKLEMPEHLKERYRGNNKNKK